MGDKIRLGVPRIVLSAKTVATLARITAKPFPLERQVRGVSFGRYFHRDKGSFRACPMCRGGRFRSNAPLFWRLPIPPFRRTLPDFTGVVIPRP